MLQLIDYSSLVLNSFKITFCIKRKAEFNDLWLWRELQTILTQVQESENWVHELNDYQIVQQVPTI